MVVEWLGAGSHRAPSEIPAELLSGWRPVRSCFRKESRPSTAVPGTRRPDWHGGGRCGYPSFWLAPASQPARIAAWLPAPLPYSRGAPAFLSIRLKTLKSIRCSVFWRPPSARTVGFGFFAGGGLFLCLGTYLLFDAAVFASSAVPTDGVVTKMESAPEGRCAPMVRYDVESRDYTFTSRVSSNPPRYAVGDPVRVLYQPDNHAVARIGTFEALWMIPLTSATFGAIFLALGAIVLSLS